jgi:hypothetical protein
MVEASGSQIEFLLVSELYNGVKPSTTIMKASQVPIMIRCYAVDGPMFERERKRNVLLRRSVGSSRIL